MPVSSGPPPQRTGFKRSSETCRTDERELQVIEEEIGVFGETLISLQTNLKARIVQRKKQRNGLIRFNRLPVEIASNILLLSIVEPWKKRISLSFRGRQKTISSVCSSWRSLVEYSPRFWSVIEFPCSQAAISDSLEKSQSSSLEIKCFTEIEYDFTPPEDLIGLVEQDYWSIIAPHIGRIWSLIVYAPATEALLSLLKHPAPILEELKLDCSGCDFLRPLDLFCGQASQLRDVALKNIPVRWDSAVLVGLRSLGIKENLENLLTEGQVRRLLEANPGLEKLDIENETYMETFGEPKSNRLVKDSQLVRAFLCNVEFPSIRSLQLECLCRGQPASKLLGSSIKYLVSLLLQQSKGTPKAELTFGRSSIELTIYNTQSNDERPTIGIRLKETVPISGFEWLAENLFHVGGFQSVGEADVFTVALIFGGGFNMAGGTFIPILNRLNAVKVKDLSIRSGCEHGEELIKYLGNLKEDSQWSLPYLSSMTMSGPTELADHLSITLKRRKQKLQNTPAGERQATQRAVMLEVLDIGGLLGVDREVEKALAKCVAASGKFIPAQQEHDIFADSSDMSSVDDSI
ncbi:hypothetical protein FS837_004674 [Tulasnella sp. UAMH 9824]|nr:hypothetical protein FS837_004674 [Tulasnella sp. UAMH 9824]